MEVVEGVRLHFIKSQKFKTNRIKMRFSAPMSLETVAGRVLVASMLETANQLYPTAQLFRERLAQLYGADYTTSVSRRGLVHYLDIDLSFVRDTFLSRKNILADQMLDFLAASLFRPLAGPLGFDAGMFEIEKRNLIMDLEAEIENHFYHAHRELSQLFYQKEEMRMAKVANIELVQEETAQSSYQVFQNMLQRDQIDLFFIGDFNEIEVREKVKSFGFSGRTNQLNYQYQQKISNVVQEGFETRDTHQSILELGYHFSIQYGDTEHLPLTVLNALLGGFSHSKLFVNLREKEGLAYTISSNLDIFSGLLRIYAGIDRQNRTKTLSLIHKEISSLKKGSFSEEDLLATKKMLKNAFLLSLDKQSSLIERAYMTSLFGRKCLSTEAWLEALEAVSKKDVQEVAGQLKLQAVYFMEGRECKK